MPSPPCHADRASRRGVVQAWLVLVLVGLAGHAPAAAPQAAYVEGEALVIFKAGTTGTDANKSAARHHATSVRNFEAISRHRQRAHCHVRSDTQSTAALIAALRSDPAVELAEPNYRRSLAGMAVPNDVNFAKLWALRNTGQYVNGYPGTAGVDIRFLDAWGMAKSNPAEIVVAVLDSGIDLTQPELAANLWVNAAEIGGDGLDNDGNGKVDDIHGYDFANNDADPTDAGLHGSHVSGIIAAMANNQLGVTGTAFDARIMPLKISTDGTTISTAAEIAAIDYAVMMKGRGVNVVAINASFVGPNYSAAENHAIQTAADAGIVLCTAAGNEGADNTAIATYPPNYRLPNMIVVAAIESTGQLASFSNFGTKVDLAAPGVDIYSTIPVWKGTPATSLTRGATSYAIGNLEFTGLTSGVSGTLYHCGSGGAGEFPAAVHGNIALIQRGSLTFAAKVTNAMNAGARAVVIYNNTTGSILGTLGTPGNWIPAMWISQADGLALAATLPATVSLYNILPSSVYTYKDGTSMAAPYVTAAVAFAARNFPSESAAQRVARIINHATPSGYLTGKVLSGGRLDLARMVDTDADGLPDWWETDYLGGLAGGPAADADNDGFTNLQEYLIGTLPNNSGSRLAVFKAEVVANGSNNDFRVSFPTAAGVTYRVERNDTLAAGSWVQLGSDVSGTGAPASATDGGAVTLHPRRFYRVRIVAP